MSYLRTIFVLLLIFLFALASHTFADSKPVINEFLPHPSTGDKEWVEMYVPDGMDVTNYWIDDDTDFANDSGSSSKKQITSVVAGSDSRHVVFELSSSMFNNGGDTIALFAQDGSLVDQYTYASDPGVDISIGRTPDATGNFQVLAAATRGSPNSSPKPTETPTPMPTDKPTKEPKPTETPKPPKPTATSNTSVNTANVLADKTSIDNFAVSKDTFLPTETASEGARPTSVLAAATKATVKKIAKQPNVAILVKASSGTSPQIIAVMLGGVLLVGCGILLYLKKQSIWPFKPKS